MDILWYNTELRDKTVVKFKDRHPNFDIAEFLNIIETADSSNTGELRALATSFNSYGADFKEAHIIKDKLNSKFRELIGPEMTELMDKLTKTQSHELWSGDQLYELLFIGGAIAYYPRVVLKSALYLLHDYIGKELKSEDLSEICALYSKGTTWDLTYTAHNPSNLDWQNCDKDFNILNKERKRETDAWVEFVDILIKRDTETAYKLMFNHRTEYEKARGRSPHVYNW